MDSRTDQGDIVIMKYEKYWNRRVKHPTEGNMLKHHTEWGLGPIVKYDATTNTYQLLVVDPHARMLKCIEYGW